MDLANTIGWIGNLFFIWGVYELGIKKIRGFYLNILGNSLYIIQSLVMDNLSLLWLSIGLVILNIKGVLEWRREYEKNN